VGGEYPLSLRFSLGRALSQRNKWRREAVEHKTWPTSLPWESTCLIVSPQCRHSLLLLLLLLLSLLGPRIFEKNFMLIGFIARASQAARTVAQTSNHLKVPQRANMASLGAHSKKHKVTVVGSGNWSVVLSYLSIVYRTRLHRSLVLIVQ